MNKEGFTLVELLAVIVLLGLVLVITMTNGFGIFNKAKGGINQIEENNLIEAAKVFLVDVENEFVTTGFDNNKIRVVCEDGSCFYISIDSNNVITKKNCIDTFCGTEVDIKYLKDNMYFNDSKDKCDNNAKFNIRLEGNLEYTDYIVKKEGTDAFCPNAEDSTINIDYKLINAAKDYLKKIINKESVSYADSCSSVESFYDGCELYVSELETVASFTADTGYDCIDTNKLKLQIFGRFNTVDYVVEKQNDNVICSN